MTIDELIKEITPLFIELPEDADETWTHGVLFDGLTEYTDGFILANSFKLAGDRLIETALENREGNCFVRPFTIIDMSLNYI